MEHIKIYLGESQKGHFPDVFSHKIAINLSIDPNTALCTMTGLEKPFLRVTCSCKVYFLSFSDSVITESFNLSTL